MDWNSFQELFFKCLKCGNDQKCVYNPDVYPKTIPGVIIGPQPGYLGRDFPSGGVVLMGINPGLGEWGKTFIENGLLPERWHNKQYLTFGTSFTQLMEQDLQYMFLWKVIKEINHVLRDLDVNPLYFWRRVTYLNQIKCRGVKMKNGIDNWYPEAKERLRCFKRWTLPQLEVLPFGAVIILQASKQVDEIVKDPEVQTLIKSRNYITKHWSRQPKSFRESLFPVLMQLKQQKNPSLI